MTMWSIPYNILVVLLLLLLFKLFQIIFFSQYNTAQTESQFFSIAMSVCFRISRSQVRWAVTLGATLSILLDIQVLFFFITIKKKNCGQNIISVPSTMEAQFYPGTPQGSPPMMRAPQPWQDAWRKLSSRVHTRMQLSMAEVSKEGVHKRLKPTKGNLCPTVPSICLEELVWHVSERKS